MEDVNDEEISLLKSYLPEGGIFVLLKLPDRGTRLPFQRKANLFKLANGGSHLPPK